MNNTRALAPCAARSWASRWSSATGCVFPVLCCAYSLNSLAPTAVFTTWRNRWLRRVDGGRGGLWLAHSAWRL